jgi:hypothetical protein
MHKSLPASLFLKGGIKGFPLLIERKNMLPPFVKGD